MGLPLFMTPAEPEPATGVTAEKLISGARSSIRRGRLGSRPRTGISSARVISEAQSRWTEALFDSEHGDRETSRNQGLSSSQVDSHALALNYRTLRTFERERDRMRLRHAMSFERHHTHNSDNDVPSLPPAVPELRNRAETEDPSLRPTQNHNRTSHLRRMRGRYALTTPPHQNEEPQSHSLSRLDFDFPLSYPDNPEHRQVLSSIHGSEASDQTINSSSTSRAYPLLNSTIIERIRALNRISNEMTRSRRSMLQINLDGLGDRNRSLSPDSGVALQTLLTSITPDPLPRRERTTFASISATTPNLPGTLGPVLLGTIMTGPEAAVGSPLQVGFLSDSTTDAEDETEQRYISDQTRQGGSPPNLINSSDALLSQTEVADIEDMGAWHCLISRLTERNDIPDEWWASAGLSRNLRARTETQGGL